MNLYILLFSHGTNWSSRATAVGTLLLAGVAIFGGRVYAWYFRPRLKISYSHSSPDAHKIPVNMFWTGIAGNPWGYSFSPRIHNDGRGPAHNVEVFASRLSKYDGTDFREMKAFIPKNLSWSQFDEWFAPAILPNMYRHCNLGVTTDPRDYPEGMGPRTILFLTLQGIPNTPGYQITPGLYRLFLKIAAENINKPVEAIMEMDISGDWFSEEDDMLRQGMKIRLLNHRRRV